MHWFVIAFWQLCVKCGALALDVTLVAGRCIPKILEDGVAGLFDKLNNTVDEDELEKGTK